MDDRRIEEKIQQAIKNDTPNMLDQILSSCNEQKGNVVMMKSKKNLRWITTVAAAAAALLLGIGAYGMGQWRDGSRINSIVMLDVNPSISLNVNKNERVLSVVAHNEDGKHIIGDMDFKNTDLDVTVNALLGSMLQKGYLSDIQNAILVSVENDDSNKREELQNKLSNMIQEILQGNAFESAVLSQSVDATDSIKNLATEYGISEGKAALIKKVTTLDPTLNFEALSKMSVHDITILADSKKLELQSVSKTGQASTKGYITEAKAKETAFAHAGVTDSLVKGLEIEFDVEDGLMVYELEFYVGNTEYEYDINAITSEVVKFSKEIDDDEINTQEVSTYIGKEAAKLAALSHANLSEKQVGELEIELDQDDKAVYEIEFETTTIEYDYKIDAVSGAVVSFSSENKQKMTEKTTEKTAKPSTSYIGESKAKTIALTHGKVSAEDIYDYTIELDTEDKKKVYEIEFETKTKEFDYVIDAVTGKILDYEIEAKDTKKKDSQGKSTQNSNQQGENNQDGNSQGVSSSKNIITAAKAKSIALEHRKVKESQVKDYESELDKDGNKATYEIEFVVGTTEYKYEIDAITGAVLKSKSQVEDQDDDDDDDNDGQDDNDDDDDQDQDQD